jgi:hypothetical protein
MDELPLWDVSPQNKLIILATFVALARVERHHRDRATWGNAASAAYGALLFLLANIYGALADALTRQSSRLDLPRT